MSLLDKINIVIRNAARSCAFACSKKIPKELDMFILAAHQVNNADKQFLSNWPDTWPDQEDDLINETMWYALELYNDHYEPDMAATANDAALQKQFIKFYNTVFKQARNIADIFGDHFDIVEKMMRDIAKATGAKGTDIHDAPYAEYFYDGASTPYLKFAECVFKYLE